MGPDARSGHRYSVLRRFMISRGRFNQPRSLTHKIASVSPFKSLMALEVRRRTPWYKASHKQCMRGSICTDLAPTIAIIACLSKAAATRAQD
jgi:hypothetical protein